MKFRPWMRILAWIVLALAIGVVVFFLAETVRYNGHGTYTFRRFAKKLHIELPPPKPLTPSEERAAAAEAAAWKVKFLAEFPALKIPEHPVEAEENGFLLLLQLGNSLPITGEFSQILSNIPSCDASVAKRCLAEHAEFVAKVERIASLRTRSSMGMPADYNGFISARSAKQSGEILLLKARLAAEAGDENETLRWVSAAANLADHFRGVEARSFQGETVCLMMDLQRQRFAFTTLLPALGKPADLERWKSVLGRGAYSTAEYANLMRGEWHIGADFLAFPLLATEEKLGYYADAEEVMHCYSSWVNDVVTRLPSLDLATMDSVLTPLPARTAKLSEENRELVEMMTIGSKSWANCYVRAAVVSAQAQAAMDLLILEKSGTQLVATDANRITRDPVCGQPFVFDPTKRELIAPPGSAKREVEPLVLPW